VPLSIPNITKVPPTMPHILIKNLDSELFYFVIYIVKGENSISIFMN